MSNIKSFKLFCNNNDKSNNVKKLVKDKMIKKGFLIKDKDYDLAIAIGGDGSFLRMVKSTNFNSDTYYIGINSGTLGFMQEVKLDEIDKFVSELKSNKYKTEDIGIQETTINYDNKSSKFYSLNEIVVRDTNLKVVKLAINIDNDLLEKYMGDGILIASSSGSTAHNLSYGGSIVYNTFTSLQITHMGPINSKVYKSLINSVIVPDKKIIYLIPEEDHKNLIVTIDGENNIYDNVESISTKIDNKKIKCLRLSHYNFPEKINEKLLSD